MPPLPKDPALRQRRNRASTQAVLQLEVSPRKRAPNLPKLTDATGKAVEWHPLTRAWWRDIWRSPMANEFLRADLHGLYLLASLVDKFWREPSTALAAEIRLQRQAYGLSPIDRRRLQWTVEKTEETVERRRAKPKRAEAAEDPRKILKVVK